MNFFALFLTYLICFNSFAAPMGVSGQNQSNKYPSVIKVPNNQATDIGSSSSLLETGNKNRLINPGFEHSTFSTGWTTAVTSTATITAAVETTSPLEGKKSGKYTCAGGASGGTCTIYQDVTTTHTPQGAAALYVKSDTVWSPSTSTGVQIFSRKDGVNFQSKNVDVTSDKLFSIPVTLSNVTSTGVAAVITVAASQTIIVYLDEGYVGAADLKQDFSPTGPMISYGAINITATTTAPTKATTREKDDVSCRINGQYYECIYEYRAASATGSAIGSGGYIFNLPSGIAMDTNYQYTTTNRATFSAYDGLRAAASIGFGDVEYTGNGDTGGKCDVYATSSTTFQANCFFGGTNNWMISSGEAPVINQANAGMKFQIRFRGAGLASNYSAYSTTNANTSLASCGLSASDFVGFGTVTSIEDRCYRDGEHLVMNVKFTPGTPTATEARVNLKLGGAALTSANTSKIPSLRYAGKMARNTTGGDNYTVLIEPSTGYVVFGVGYTSGTELTKTLGTNMSTSGLTHSFEARIPIDTWDNSNIIIGQFNGLESCSNSFQCETEYTAKVSASCAVTDQTPAAWINTCTLSGSSDCICTHITNTFTSIPNFTATSQSTVAETDRHVSVYSASKDGFSTKVRNGANADSPTPITVKATKTGADYVTKTARAVASDANLRSVGSVGVDYQAVYFGAGTDCSSNCTTGNCTICKQVGSKITSVSFVSTGVYNVNGVDGTKYICSVNGPENGVGYASGYHRMPLSTSSLARIEFGVTNTNRNVGNASVQCVGIP